MNTLFALMAEYETVNIPLDRVCRLFGISADEAAKRAIRHQLPVPAYRAGSQKSPWMVDAQVLAIYLDSQKLKATRDWQRVQGKSP